MEAETISKFEKARILGTRALQLSKGAPPMVDTTGINDVMEIAKKELKSGKMPIIIRKPNSNGTFTDFRVSSMVYNDQN